ncbi:MAG: rRNA maturation RNase YbeY [Gemmatimonadota bacterium]|nr:rRNA maturation RNase YbeY [Gemmatimonadota bacterium]
MDVLIDLPEEWEARRGSLERAVRHVLEAEGWSEGEISLTLLDDVRIQALNRTYLAHDRPTDVISFSLGREGGPPLGDVYVGVDQARRQSAELGVPVEEELVRLAVHGTLHVLGYDHPEGDERTDGEMFLRQEELVGEILREPELPRSD